MKIFSTVLATIGFATLSMAQGTGNQLTGQVSSGSKPIDAASISILKKADSSIVKVAATTKDGKYVISDLPEGEYLVQVSAVGYNKKYSGHFKVSSADTSVLIPAIELQNTVNNLKDVVVTTRKPLIEQKPGKTIVNVDASPSNSGISALDLLEKSPGISIDKDGNISLRGKQGVMILLDGKPTYLSGADLVNMLKNMPSNNLEQLEIMTNPPAKYDAAGNSGIINIKTKKSNTRGTNGNMSVSYSQGEYGRTNNNININHRNNNINIFGGYGYSRYEGFNDLTITRRFYLQDNKTIAGTSDQKSRPHFKGNNHTAKIGLDYYLSKKDVLGVLVNTYFNKGVEDPASASNVRNSDGGILYSLKSINDNSFKFHSISTNLNYKHTFDSTGKELTADVDYSTYNKNNLSLMTTQTFDANGQRNALPVSLKGVIPAAIDIYSLKVDYVHPFNKTTKLEAGAKTSLVRTDNEVEYLRSTGGAWSVDSRSNHFIYNENINAAYATVSKQVKKWNFIAGVRLENTGARGTQVKTDSSFTRNYTNLFPNLGIGFEASKKHQFNFSYSRRIDRPDYDDLNPFTFFLDSLTYGQGNPYLQPQFTNNLELTHSFNRWLNTTINYNQTDNVMTQMFRQDTERKITYQIKDNVSRMRQIGVTVTANKSVTKWWTTNVYLNVFNNRFTGFYQADPIDIGFTSFAGNISNSFTFKNGWGAEVSGFYRSKGSDGLLVAREIYAVNAGVSKQVLKKKGSVRLGIRDIFLTQQFSGYARYSDVDVDLKSRRDSRQVTLSFNYRFGKTNFAPARKKVGGSSDEQNRVKGGGNG